METEQSLKEKILILAIALDKVSENLAIASGRDPAKLTVAAIVVSAPIIKDLKYDGTFNTILELKLKMLNSVLEVEGSKNDRPF